MRGFRVVLVFGVMGLVLVGLGWMLMGAKGEGGVGMAGDPQIKLEELNCPRFKVRKCSESTCQFWSTSSTSGKYRVEDGCEVKLSGTVYVFKFLELHDERMEMKFILQRKDEDRQIYLVYVVDTNSKQGSTMDFVLLLENDRIDGFLKPGIVYESNRGWGDVFVSQWKTSCTVSQWKALVSKMEKNSLLWNVGVVSNFAVPLIKLGYRVGRKDDKTFSLEDSECSTAKMVGCVNGACSVSEKCTVKMGGMEYYVQSVRMVLEPRELEVQLTALGGQFLLYLKLQVDVYPKTMTSIDLEMLCKEQRLEYLLAVNFVYRKVPGRAERAPMYQRTTICSSKDWASLMQIMGAVPPSSSVSPRQLAGVVKAADDNVFIEVIRCYGNVQNCVRGTCDVGTRVNCRVKMNQVEYRATTIQVVPTPPQFIMDFTSVDGQKDIHLVIPVAIGSETYDMTFFHSKKNIRNLLSTGDPYVRVEGSSSTFLYQGKDERVCSEAGWQWILEFMDALPKTSITVGRPDSPPRQFQMDRMSCEPGKLVQCVGGKCKVDGQCVATLHGVEYSAESVQITSQPATLTLHFVTPDAKHQLYLRIQVTVNSVSGDFENDVDIFWFKEGHIITYLWGVNYGYVEVKKEVDVYQREQYSGISAEYWQDILRFMDALPKAAGVEQEREELTAEEVNCSSNKLLQCKAGRCLVVGECNATLGGTKYKVHAVQVVPSPTQLVDHLVSPQTKEEIHLIYRVEVGSAEVGVMSTLYSEQRFTSLDTNDQFYRDQDAPNTWRYRGTIMCHVRHWPTILQNMNVVPSVQPLKGIMRASVVLHRMANESQGAQTCRCPGATNQACRKVSATGECEDAVCPKHELTPEKVGEFKEVFALFDKNGDGRVEVSELGKVMESFGQHLSDDQLAHTIQTMDVDGNGSFDFPEFIVMMSCMKPPDPEEELRQAFRVFDVDGTGFMTSEELYLFFTRIDIPVTREMAEEMMRDMDTDGDGRINYEEFKKMMMNLE